MKKISVIIPCYNEELSVHEMAQRLRDTFGRMEKYDYEIIFVDDCSPDSTWARIEEECAADRRCKGVHNITNFGPTRNIFNSFRYGDGDAWFLLMGDLQQPPERLEEFAAYWEQGHAAVVGVQANTEDRGLKAWGRKVFYRLIDRLSGHRMIPNFAGYGLYDRKIVEVIRNIDDMQPYLPGIIAEYGGRLKLIPVTQEASRRGRSNQNFIKKYDSAMIGLTSYTKLLMRLCTFVGCIFGLIAAIFAIYSFIMKLTHWDSYPMGIPSIIVGVFFIGALELFFLGIMGEYILSINERSMSRPLTVPDKLLNFDTDGEDK